ncbi:MAG: acetate--CoA ligase family protein [Syntrophobacteraceae bacterium]|jgi:acyl-CoA synthetase (NDP forming)|nr:acetate--CoA ligase family protein [Syntrophobacteraceae bacterium]
MILPEHEANRMLASAGVPMIPLRAVRSVDEALKEATMLGYPVALKLSSAIHTHKTEVGGVILSIGEASELREAFARLNGLRDRLDPDAVLIMEPMAGVGAECFVGFQRHPQFGPVVSFGLGGISLELFKDVAFRLLPAGEADFREMLSELKCWPALRAGFRNLAPVDEESVVGLLLQVADLAMSRPDIGEMDLNPVIMGIRGAIVADATIVMG